MEIALSAKKICTSLAIIAFSLMLGNIAVEVSSLYLGHDHLMGIVPLFSFYSEANLPTWYSTLILFIASLLLAIVTCVEANNGSKNVLYWGGLCVIFMFLSLDEAALLHEKIGSVFRLIINPVGALRNVWVVPGAGFVLLFGLIYWRFLRSLPKTTSRLFVVAGMLYFGGAVGLEVIENLYYSRFGGGNVVLASLVTIEELMEMVGVIIFVYGVLVHLGSAKKTIQFCVE